MGVGEFLQRVISDFQKIIKDMLLFIVSYTIIIFIIGEWFGRMTRYNTEAMWYPVYGLIIVLIIKWLSDLGPKPKKEEKKK